MGGAGSWGFYALLVGVGLLGAISDAILNQWAKAGGAGWLVGSYVAWCAVATVLGVMFRAKHFAFGTAMVVFLLSNVVFALVIDRVAFEGRITKMQWAGIGMAVASLVVLELGKAPE
jgi:hypothetical protein